VDTSVSGFSMLARTCLPACILLRWHVTRIWYAPIVCAYASTNLPTGPVVLVYSLISQNPWLFPSCAVHVATQLEDPVEAEIAPRCIVSVNLNASEVGVRTTARRFSLHD
jgi:hypothetical protein